MEKRDELMALRLKKPFTPFRITLADNGHIDVTDQLTFAVGQTAILMARPSRGALEVQMEDIVSIDVLEPAH